MRVLILTASLLLIAACDAPPVVSDFNGSSVKLQTSSLVSVRDAKAGTQIEAGRICGKVGKQAEYASTRTLPNYVSEHLYLCL